MKTKTTDELRSLLNHSRMQLAESLPWTDEAALLATIKDIVQELNERTKSDQLKPKPTE